MSALEFLELLAGSLAKGAVLLVAATIGVRLLRRRSAAGRYAVWVAAFAGLVLLPPLTLSLPSLEPGVLGPDGTSSPHGDILPVGRAEVGGAPIATGRPDMVGRSAGAGMPEHAEEMRGSATMAHDGVSGRDERSTWRPAVRAWAPWLLAVWLSGVSLVLLRLARDVRRISAVTRRAAPLCRGSLQELCVQVAAELGVHQPVRLALTRELAVPVSWGVRRPVVLLPVSARSWSAERKRVVLGHELAHVRRGDYAGHLLIELACALHWPNPYAWRAAHRARLEQEQACDDRVLGLGTGPVEYAQHLLDIARTFAAPTIAGRGALAMAATATLPERMRAILDVGMDHRPAGQRTLLAVGAAAVLVGVPTAAVHPWSDATREKELVDALLRSPQAAIRRDAAWGLGARGAQRSNTALRAALDDGDAATRGVAAWALGKLGDRAAVAPLISALRDADPQVREMAVLALGALRDPRAVGALAPLARDPEHGVRSVTTVALKQIGGEQAAEALATLVRSDADPHTRVMAASALAHVESGSRVAVLLAALADPESDVRATAAHSLEALESRASVPGMLAALDREEHPEVREALARALAASRDPRATAGLVRVLTDEEPRLRETAAEMLGTLGDERAVEPLIAATR
ncbi:MAG TPA: M56 family metallopeptidase, partial [Gemmatimonadales bacterium]|nr:M56 family metallopeptidase [Gemmatimonadales bacterium]